jgi:FkbM family methyltransferase
MIPQLKNGYKRFLFNLSASNSRLYTGYYRYLYKPRRGTLADLLDSFSKQNTDITFLQVGANDGFFHDPLHKFIKMYGWRGVLLEPQRGVFDRYLSRLYANVPGVVPVNAALDFADGEKSIYKIAFSESRWATGLTSFSKEALEEAIESGHVARCADRYGERLPENRNEYIKTETITCISPATLISAHHLGKIDWVQIDAEGYDFQIIRMLEIEKTSPRVIVFEDSHLSKEDYGSCLQLLGNNGYGVTRIQENTVAMKLPVTGFERFFNSTTGKN